MTNSITFAGWESITDVACIMPRCTGLLRWAEAGHVPGYRVCDQCGSHYALRDRDLVCVQRRRSTKHKIELAQYRRAAEEAQAKQFHAQWRAKITAELSAQWPISRACPHGVHGVGSVEIPPEVLSGDDRLSASAIDIEDVEPQAYRDLIRRCWELSRMLRASKRTGVEAVNLPRVISATRDGSAVLVYHVEGCYLPLDGWWHTTSLIAVLGGDASWGRRKLTLAEMDEVGVWR